MRATDLRRHIAEFNKSDGFEQQFKVVQDHPLMGLLQKHMAIVFKTLCCVVLDIGSTHTRQW